MADGSLPFAGVVMCCTSIPPETRSRIAEIATQLGAEHKFDLTSDVTHLIVGEVNTPKYKYVAKERPDVKCLLPDFVEAVRQSWIKGGETDVKELEEMHKLPTFFRLRICVTGFEDMGLRKQIEEAVSSNGGEYRPDLTKEVTHLIAAKPSGTKYDYGKIWGIRIVALEWLQISLERGMVLEESLFDPLISKEEREEKGRSAWVRRSESVISLLKRTREQDASIVPARKLRRTASSKFESHAQGIWGDIIGSGNGRSIARTESLLSGVDDPFALPDKLESKKVDRRSITPKRPRNPMDAVTVKPRGFLRPQALFEGRRFYVHGFDAKKTSILKRHLEANEAEMVSEIEDLVKSHTSSTPNSSFLVVPHSSTPDDVPNIPSEASSPIVVTDMWVERCLFKKEFQEPQSRVTHGLFKHPLPGFSNLKISSTAFEGVDLKHLAQVVNLLGSKYEEVFTPDVAVLICNDLDISRDKVVHAKAWNIPTVKVDWLWKSINVGNLEQFDDFLLQPLQDKNLSLSQREQTVQKQPTTNKPSMEKKVSTDPFTASTTSDIRRKESPVKPKRRNLGDLRKTLSRLDGAMSGQDASLHESEPTKQESRNKPLPSKNREGNVIGVMADTSDYSRSSRQPKLSYPLQEISSNSPPRSSLSPAKTLDSIASDLPATSLPPHESPETLHREISSMLARRQEKKRTLSKTSSVDGYTTTNNGHRNNTRKPRLLSRATSNLSNRSNPVTVVGGLSLSRASSVDTLNTDGLGTPLLEAPHVLAVADNCLSNPSKVTNTVVKHINGNNMSSLLTNSNNDALTASLFDDDESDENPLKNTTISGGRNSEHMPSTQLNYDDPESGLNRTKLMEKIYGKQGANKDSAFSEDRPANGNENVQNGRITKAGGRLGAEVQTPRASEGRLNLLRDADSMTGTIARRTRAAAGR